MNTETCLAHLFEPNDFRLIICIHADSGIIQARTFESHETAPMLAYVHKMNKDGWNIYVQYNPVAYKLNKKPQRTDVRAMNVIHVDIDPREGESYESCLERTMKRVAEWVALGQPMPTAIIKSGNGLQLIWKLKTPIPVNGDIAKCEELKLYNVQVEKFFGGDACHNVDRILRFPGTTNLPNAKKKAAGRKPSQAEILSFEKVSYPIDSFKKAIETQSGTTLKSDTAALNISGNIQKITDLDTALAPYPKIDDRVKVIIYHGRDPERPKQGDNSRSAWLYDGVCQLVRANVPDETIYAIITDETFGIAESVVDKGRRKDSYARKQIADAKAEVSDPDLAEMNRKYAWIENYGGKAMIAYEANEAWGEDDDGKVQKRNVLRFQRPPEIASNLSNRNVQIGVDAKGRPVMKALFKYWAESPDRRQYESVTFQPGGAPANQLNMWQGFAVEAVPGDRHTRLRDHIFENICGGDQAGLDYYWKWMAYNIQFPGRRPQTAIALRGGQGTGKSLAVKSYGHLFGNHYLPIVTANALTGDFNGHLQNAKLVFADEAIFARDKRQVSKLKGLITEEELSVNAKGFQQQQVPNHIALILASNDDAVINAAADERRYAVYDVGTKKQQDSAYFKAIVDDLKRGGYENLMYELMNMDLSSFEIRKIPKNGALQNQKLQSLSPLEDWWYYKLESGVLLQDRWPECATIEALREDYGLSANLFGRPQYGMSDRVFGSFIRKVLTLPGRVPLIIRGQTGAARQRSYVIPALQECRQIWECHYGFGIWTDVHVQDAGAVEDIVPF